MVVIPDPTAPAAPAAPAAWVQLSNQVGM
jgi:hypothetical protein